MQEDFHYYATYSAAYLAGYTHEECIDICYSDQLVDLCTKTFLSKLRGPLSAATTQLQLELVEMKEDTIGLQYITRIWSSFHFLPYDLNAEVKGSKTYKNKYRLICDTNSDLLVDTVNLAKDRSLQAVGIAMHVLADTWAHRYFAGTPSIVINSTYDHFYELVPKSCFTDHGDSSGIIETCYDDREYIKRKVKFIHSLGKDDDLENGVYTSTISQMDENSIMSLGHGRAGHLPDYSFARYAYLPAWGKYVEIIKDNPKDYFCAYTQMIHAMKFLNGKEKAFEKNRYDTEAVSGLEDEIKSIFEKRQLLSCDDWKAFGEKLSGKEIPDFDLERYQDEYTNAADDEKDDTFLGRFFIAAMRQKSMVTNKIFKSGSKLAGYSVDYDKKGFKGIKDYKKLVK